MAFPTADLGFCDILLGFSAVGLNVDLLGIRGNGRFRAGFSCICSQEFALLISGTGQFSHNFGCQGKGGLADLSSRHSSRFLPRK